MGAHCSSWLCRKLAEARRYFDIGGQKALAPLFVSPLERLRAVDVQLTKQLAGSIEKLGFQHHRELVRAWTECAICFSTRWGTRPRQDEQDFGAYSDELEEAIADMKNIEEEVGALGLGSFRKPEGQG